MDTIIKGISKLNANMYQIKINTAKKYDFADRIELVNFFKEIFDYFNIVNFRCKIVERDYMRYINNLNEFLEAIEESYGIYSIEVIINGEFDNELVEGNEYYYLKIFENEMIGDNSKMYIWGSDLERLNILKQRIERILDSHKSRMSFMNTLLFRVILAIALFIMYVYPNDVEELFVFSDSGNLFIGIFYLLLSVVISEGFIMLIPKYRLNYKESFIERFKREFKNNIIGISIGVAGLVLAIIGFIK